MPQTKREKSGLIARSLETDLSLLMDSSQRAISKLPLDDPQLLSGDCWGELRMFLAVAKAKSFNRAAETLNVSRITVRTKINRLQDLMGAQLLVRSKSGIALTRKGKDLADHLLRLDQMLFSIGQDMSAESREAEGTVRVTCTEAMTGLFIVPSVREFNAQHPKVHFNLRNPVSLTDFYENQSDVFVGLGSLSDVSIKSKAVGYLHLIGIASRTYLERHGHPTRKNLKSHRFVEAGYYASRTPTYESWHAVVAQGTIAHQCDNSFAYALLVKDGAGIGLLGNFTLADPDVVPIGLDIHVRLPIFIHAEAQRLQAKPVRLAFEWLCDVFSPENPLFSSRLILDAPSKPALESMFQKITVDTQVSRLSGKR